MHRIASHVVLCILAVLLFCPPSARALVRSAPLIVDHACADLAKIPEEYITKARESLHVAYGHTSHGSQIVTGMTGLVGFKGALYAFDSGGNNGMLDLRDTPFSGAEDLGNPNLTAWEAATRAYLIAHTEITVVMWSWCGQVSWSSEADIARYCALMDGLEKEYPGVNFVYITGHLDGTGLTGNLHLRNEQIRRFCRENNKILYDFNDIESYDPDGVWFGDKIPNDACDYDTNGDGTRDDNWALKWQGAHPGEWYSCESAHSQPLNANRKAYAAWWLFARLAGWDGDAAAVESTVERVHPIEFLRNYPNPFNPSTTIEYRLPAAGYVLLEIYTINGQRVRTLTDRKQQPGNYTVQWDGIDELGQACSSGIYLYTLRVGEFVQVRKMILVR